YAPQTWKALKAELLRVEQPGILTRVYIVNVRTNSHACLAMQRELSHSLSAQQI
ncbi:hypothetical protein HETIRDRAFT_317500, partial [Heterobasidion irregulare TC 32-1]